jgi:ATP-dependent metalloprotease FtsH
MNSIQRRVLEKQNQVDEVGGAILPSISDITFNDVAGIKDVRDELEEVIDFLKNPTKYSDFGVKLPKGVLLVGPPGVGKTLIAKAVAGEANVPFFYQSGSSFVQIYVGVGAKRVRELFAIAKAKAPSIIFIDEIDAIGKSRGNFRNDERESTLNQLLTEMDGFEESKGVIVIGATNRLEMLDDALLRAGRFDRRVFVSLPTFEERRAILEVYLRDKTSDVDLDILAKMTVGFNGATISSLVNEAGIYALKNGKDVITMDDFLAIKDKVAFGKKRHLTFNENQKHILATYQGAKSIVGYWLDIEFDKISLINDGFKESDRDLLSKSDLLNRIKLYLAGICAYDIKYQERYSNSAEDLERAKALATKMVNEYGMGEKILPHPEDIESILSEAINDNKEFLSRVIYILDEIEDLLIEKETLSFEELKALMNSNNF